MAPALGRPRALEIVLNGDLDVHIAERYGWVNRTLDDDDLDSFVDTLVRRVTSFDREASSSASLKHGAPARVLPVKIKVSVNS
ncbi:MAG TPA: hypothetical protein VJ747_08330 [Stellaceae bacterium]|nr:hypothetical protein [Stellaceae bacterium]